MGSDGAEDTLGFSGIFRGAVAACGGEDLTGEGWKGVGGVSASDGNTSAYGAKCAG